MTDVFGLLSPSAEPIPLVAVKVDGDIVGRSARVLVSQTFRNNENTPIEAVYKFPLPEGSAICGFKASINGRSIQGQVEEREKAFDIYDKALEKGAGGYLLDEERPNIFTLSVGNLNPGAKAIIEIEYISLLDIEGKKIRFFLPTTISPRYIPDGMGDDNGIPVDGSLHPPYSSDVPYGLSVALRIHKGEFLQSVESPSHQVKIENLRGDPIRVSLSAENVRMDRDFILYMDCTHSSINRAYQYHTLKEAFIQLDFQPDMGLADKGPANEDQSADLNREIIFLIDCSGSMKGDSIGEARKALEICLRGLEEGRPFNIYRFGSSHESLWQEADSYSEKTADEALAYLKNINADLGGTEILRPLEEICSSKRRGGVSHRDIILLTDGEVGNENEIFKLIRKNNRNLRVFPVGIGAGCNEYFIKGLARAGRGAPEFIFPGERIEPKVLGLFGKLAHEVVTDLSIAWGESATDQAPAMPALFMGSPVTVFARFTGASIGKSRLDVKGKANGRDRTWDVEVIDLYEDDLPIPALWAREKIRDLEESGDTLLKGSRQNERKKEQLRNEIIGISKRFGVLSQSTSYVAVEERDERDKTTDGAVLRKVPVLVSVGWHGVGRLRAPEPRYALQESIMASSVREKTYAFIPSRDEPAAEIALPGSTPSQEAFLSNLGRRRNRESARDRRMDLLLRILPLQRPEGGMMLDGNIARELGFDFNEVLYAAKQITARIRIYEGWRSIDPVLLLSTAILIQALEYHFRDNREVWERVVEKSKAWLRAIIDQTRPRIDSDDLMSFAKKFVKRIRMPKG